MVKQAIADRRNWIRAKRILSIQFRQVKTNKRNNYSPWYLSTTQDMSLGGLTFYTDKEFRSGDILELKVIMSGVLNIFKGYGKVVRIEKKRMGAYAFVAIKFVEYAGKMRPAKTYLSSKKSHKKARKRI